MHATNNNSLAIKNQNHRFTHSKISKIISLVFLSIAASSANSQSLEEIVVTAQLRDENLQDVPISESIVSGEDLQNKSINDVQELMWSVPNLTVGTNQSSGTGNFSIRGIGTGAQNFGLESSVGLYVDGVYRARQASLFNQLADIEAVEVLRGPQGTLFGKNSASGSLLLRTIAPEQDNRNAYLQFTAGNYSLANFEGASNWNVSPVISARTTFFTGSRDGWVDAVGLGELNDRSRFGLRQQFLYHPSEKTSARIIFDYSEIDETCCAALTLKDALFASNRLDDGATIPGPDAIIRALGGTVYRTGSFDNHRLSLNSLPVSENTDSGISFQFDHELTNNTLTSISAFRKFDIHDAIDADFTNVDLASRDQIAEQSMWSQEFRITSDDSKRLRYVAGVYFYGQDLESIDNLTLGTRLPAYITAASDNITALMGITAGQLGFINAAYGINLGTSFATPIIPNSVIHDYSNQDHRANAIFAQLDFDITDTLEFNLGLRYTSESKDMASNFTESSSIPGASAFNTTAITAALGITGNQALRAAGAPAGDGTGGTYNPALAGLDPTPYLPALNVLTQPGWANCLVTARFCPRENLNVNIDDDNLSGNIGLSWRAEDNTLLYLSYRTGYKSGGTNTDRIGFGFNPVFGSEETTNIEVGIKKDFPDQNLRINASLYDMEVDNLQTNTFTGTAFNLQNAGKVKVQGLELEAWWSPAGLLDIQLGYVYTDAEFDNFDNGNCQISNIFHTGDLVEAAQFSSNGFCSRSGDRVGNVADNYLNLDISKEFRIANLGLVVGAEYISYSDQIMNNNNDPFSLQDSIDFLNIRAVLNPSDNLSAMLWARNITDEGWYGTAFDTPLQDGKMSAYPREPRTYGITIRKNF